jgi:hypothetical protein
LGSAEGSDEPVYGDGFVASLEGVQCSYSGFSSPVMTEAHVVSSTLVYCSKPLITFNGCTGRAGEGLFTQGELMLTVNGDPISNPLPISALNSACEWGARSSPVSVNGSTTFYSYSGSGTNLDVQIPSLDLALEACYNGVAKPFRCPEQMSSSSSPNQYVSPVFDLTCRDEESCAWAPLTSGNTQYCPYLYAGRCYYTIYSSYQTGTCPTYPCMGYVVN